MYPAVQCIGVRWKEAGTENLKSEAVTCPTQMIDAVKPR